MVFSDHVKSKITTENTDLRGKFKQKIPNQMAKLIDRTHQTNGQQLSYS